MTRWPSRYSGRSCWQPSPTLTSAGVKPFTLTLAKSSAHSSSLNTFRTTRAKVSLWPRIFGTLSSSTCVFCAAGSFLLRNPGGVHGIRVRSGSCSAVKNCLSCQSVLKK
eukprot:CAMPEP_0171110608 /NCGR_PEP_ID=MMETSP0766_2-20121228/71921_1 /TAXON_ID=439317 /ORGANISM="Gambierdiscus australes, Strain CAWD 149" /LENGTH=108 /DNA_ID=CAMNT_0011572501 /DNA_START=461 /DNA_END=787 /DNA_ORIENTATION=-